MKPCQGTILAADGPKKKGDKCATAMYHCERCHKEGCWHKESDVCSNQALVNAAGTMRKICVACGQSIYHPL